jgi:hypothetical protein
LRQRARISPSYAKALAELIASNVSIAARR